MPPSNFSAQIRSAVERATPAFRPAARPFTSGGFSHQLIRALARDTPAWSRTSERPMAPEAPGNRLPPKPSRGRVGAGERLLSEARFLNVAETAARFGVSRMTVYRLVHAGHLP